jgi:hypothetical protein
MRLTSLSLIPAFFAGFSIVAYANLQPATDPQISIDAGNFSSPITLGSTCTPSTDGGGICDFFNDTGSTITLLEFEDSVNVPGLLAGSGMNPSGESFYPVPPASPVFTCDPTTVFTNCLISFVTPPVTTTDEVFVYFFGTDATHPGIPPLPADCLSNPDSPDCETTGHFAVNLNDGNVLTGDVGTWNTVDAGTFNTVTINTTNGAFTGVPEPSMAWILAVGCGLIFAARRVRSLNLQR